MFIYDCAVVCNKGRRGNNEDNFYLGGKYAKRIHDSCEFIYKCNSSNILCAAVTDGMGGHSFGETASYLAIKAIYKHFRITENLPDNPNEILRRCARDADEAIREKAKKKGHHDMGSTIVLAVITDNRLFFTNLGDSRIYLCRNGKISQMTKDHTNAQMLIDSGLISAEEAVENKKASSILTWYLGMDSEGFDFEIPVYEPVKLKHGDQILFFSDGVSGVLGEQEILEIIKKPTKALCKAECLSAAAYDKGSVDNMTAMVISIDFSLKDTIGWAFRKKELKKRIDKEV